MVTMLKTSIALGLVLTFSAGPCATFATERSALEPAPRPTAGSALDKAKALARDFRLQPAPDARGPETDGLGRDDNDCKYGCVDH